MELQKTKHEIKLAEWRGLVAECRASGKRTKDWCAGHGISEQTYYRWQRQVWNAGIQRSELGDSAPNTVTFVEYVATESGSFKRCPAIVLELNCGRVEIHNGADSATIEQVLLVLKKLC